MDLMSSSRGFDTCYSSELALISWLQIIFLVSLMPCKLWLNARHQKFYIVGYRISLYSYQESHAMPANLLEIGFFFHVLFLCFIRPNRGSISSWGSFVWQLSCVAFLGTLSGTLWFIRPFLTSLWESRLFLPTIRPKDFSVSLVWASISLSCPNGHQAKELSETFCRFKVLSVMLSCLGNLCMRNLVTLDFSIPRFIFPTHCTVLIYSLLW